MSKKYVNYNTDESISKYFKEVRKSKLLTVDEEVALTRCIADGDEKAVDVLVKANLKFVISIAKEYQGQGLSLSDLINDGNIGLIKAARKFDHTKGFKFISYAVWWIRQSILQSLNDNSRTVRLPSNIINKSNYLNKEISKFENKFEREPVFGEILDKDGEEMKIVSYPKSSSLNEVIGDGLEELIDLIPSDEAPKELDSRIKTELYTILDRLSPREKDILINYFGMDTNYEAMTLESIGEKYGLTKERIRQIKAKSLRKLRNYSTNLQYLMHE